jgi:hypothetical protein
LLGSGEASTPHPEADDFRIIERIKCVLTDQSLTFTERCLLAHLMLSAGRSGRAAWKHETLAAALGTSVSTSQRATRKLSESGRLRSIQRGLGRANQYQLPWYRPCRVRGSRETEAGTNTTATHTETQGDGSIGQQREANHPNRAEAICSPAVPVPEPSPVTVPFGKENFSGEDKSTSSAAVEAPSSQGDDVAVVAFRETLAELAGARMTRSDEHAVAELVREQPELDAAAIRAGVAATLVRAKGAPIRSVRYYFAEVRRCLTNLPAAESRAGYADHCARKWLRYQQEISGGQT